MQKTVIIDPAGDQYLVCRDTAFLVSKSVLASICSYFECLVAKPNWKAHGEDGVRLNHIDDSKELTALHILLLSAHNKPDEEIFKLRNARTIQTLKRLSVLCDYFGCGHIISPKFKELLEKPTHNPTKDLNIKFNDSLHIAFNLGWQWEFNARFRIMMLFLERKGKGQGEWRTCGEMPIMHLPVQIREALVKQRHLVLKQLQKAVYKHKVKLHRDARRHPTCPQHQGVACAPMKADMLQAVCKRARAKKQYVVKKSIRALLDGFAVLKNKTGRSECYMEENWCYRKLDKLWRTKGLPANLRTRMSENSRK